MIDLYSLSFNNLDGIGEGMFKRERRGTYPVPGVQIVQCGAKSESGKRNKKGKRERNFVDLRVTKFKFWEVDCLTLRTDDCINQGMNQ